MPNRDDLAAMREDYTADTLHRSDVHDDPMQEFRKWFDMAKVSEPREPNAMVISTATPDGKPSARVVLLKEIDDDGIVFYTNYNSHKGQQITANPQIAATFNWLSLEKQVRIEGTAERVAPERSEAYFQQRPLKSQIGAAASPQSQVVQTRRWLEERFDKLTEQYSDADHLPRPLHWGGIKIKAEIYEFWQGRQSRLHDRIRYTLQQDGSWRIERLAP